MPTATPLDRLNPLCLADGTLVRTAADWERRRQELHDLVIDLEYGGLPPAPGWTRAEELHRTPVRWLPEAQYVTLRVSTGPDHPYSFLLTLLIPPGPGPFPVVLNGDGCWRYVTDEISTEVIRRGYILAQFNRVEIVPDAGPAPRTTGLYAQYPQSTFGALAAWAWGYHRCVDVLRGMAVVRADQIAVAGHSRGGKTVLVAGATDPRIALVACNNSGCGGAGSFHCQAADAETLGDILRHFPYWFGPRLAAFVGRQQELPFDQHYLKAMIAPRALLTSEARGDRWANPDGTWQTHLAARAVYRQLGVESRLGIWYRDGAHGHLLPDWLAALDFMDWHFRGTTPTHRFADGP